jgi:hypothetical protein
MVKTANFILRACLKIAKGAAAGDFGFGQGGEGGASPQRAVTTEPTLDKDKIPSRPEGFWGKSRLASLLLSRRPTGGILLRRASPSSLFPKNSTPWNFKTGS